MLVPSTAAPSSQVIAAFGETGSAAPLTGGRGESWRVGRLVLKPLDRSLTSLEWEATEFASLRPEGVRLSAPIRALDGSLVVEGWSASLFIEGAHESRRWFDIIAAGESLHRATARLARPSFLEAGGDPWAVGDRVAWGELSPDGFTTVPHISRLLAQLRQIDDAPSQLVHGDLTGNVLFANGLPPGIIDFSPYWRPPGLASAIVVADALVWEGADESLLQAVRHVRSFPQLLVRALISRIVTDEVHRRTDPSSYVDAAAYAQAVDIACALCAAELR